MSEKRPSIPERFSWIAMDVTGMWWAFVSRPMINGDGVWEIPDDEPAEELEWIPGIENDVGMARDSLWRVRL